jgi:hypothetical protein
MNESSVPMWAFVALLALFQIFLGILFSRLWKAVDDNTAAVASLREALPTSYATKEDVNRHHEEDGRMFADQRDGIRKLTDNVHAIDLRVTALDGGVRDAQAGLRG